MTIIGKARLRLREDLPEMAVFIEGVERNRQGRITSIYVHSPGNSQPARIDGLALRHFRLTPWERMN